MEICFPPLKLFVTYGWCLWLMAKRKTGFVMDWLDDTRYWAGTATQSCGLSLVREDTSTFLRGAMHLLTWMGIFPEYCFVFELVAGQGLDEAGTCRVDM